MAIAGNDGAKLAMQLLDALQVPIEDRKGVRALTLRIAVDEAATLRIERFVHDADIPRLELVVHRLCVREDKEL